MKIRGKTTVDFSGSTGRREGTAPSTFNAGTSLTFGLSLSPPQSPSRSGPELPRTEQHRVDPIRWRNRVLLNRKRNFGLTNSTNLHHEHPASRLRAPRSVAGRRVAPGLLQVPDPPVLDEQDLRPQLVDQHSCRRCLEVVNVDPQLVLRRRIQVRGIDNLASVG